MKKFIVLLVSSLISSLVFADSPDASIDKLLWTCSKDGDMNSVLVYKTSETYKHSSDTVVFIDDQQVCNSLNIKCPYEGGASQSKAYYPNFRGKFIYTSTKGRYEDGVMFYSENNGMKLTSLYTGSRPGANWHKNWYFKYGQCVKHN